MKQLSQSKSKVADWYAILPEGRKRFKSGEIVERSDGKFTIWGGISYIGTFSTRKDAAAWQRSKDRYPRS